MIATSNITIDRERRQRGFTLIELLVVLAIMALLSTVAVASFSRHARWRGQHELALLRNDINHTRAEAMRRGQEMVLGKANLPRGAQFVTPGGGPPRWYPDGTAVPAALIRDGKILLKVDALTGLGETGP